MKLILFEDAEANSKQQIYATFVWRAVVVGSGGEPARLSGLSRSAGAHLHRQLAATSAAEKCRKLSR